tara:strand:- start:1095 stop:2036 length:942 start_codon:yes stop_codon:yes gene_type:complete
LNNIITKTNKFKKIKFFSKEVKILPTYKNDKFHNLLFPEKLSENNRACGGARYNGLFKNSLKEFPLISIVMPNFKEKNISKSINSILNQNYPNIELIIIDGNSGNETINIFKEYGNEIDIWVSEKDKNLWDAWNKGFLLARGDFVGIVDSSNVLYPNSLDILKKYIFENIEMDFLCGTVKKDNKIYAGFRPEDIFRQFNIIPSTVVGFYIKSTSLKKVGLLNINYKIQSDYDWLYRIIVKNKMKGMRTKGTEVFGDLGESNFSSKVSFFSALLNELKIRLHNKQGISAILFIFFGRITINFFNNIIKMIKFKK